MVSDILFPPRSDRRRSLIFSHALASVLSSIVPAANIACTHWGQELKEEEATTRESKSEPTSYHEIFRPDSTSFFGQ